MMGRVIRDEDRDQILKDLPAFVKTLAFTQNEIRYHFMVLSKEMA